jgi:hypothetical protein
MRQKHCLKQITNIRRTHRLLRAGEATGRWRSGSPLAHWIWDFTFWSMEVAWRFYSIQNPKVNSAIGPAGPLALKRAMPGLPIAEIHHRKSKISVISPDYSPVCSMTLKNSPFGYALSTPVIAPSKHPVPTGACNPQVAAGTGWNGAGS